MVRVDVSIWRITATADLAARALTQLDARDRARVAAIGHEVTRDASTVAAALIRQAVAELAGGSVAQVRIDRRCPDCDRWHGRPEVLAPPGVEVAISHSGRAVLVAAARDARLGVDIEAVGSLPDPVDPDLLATVLHPDEPADVDWRRLGRYWVRKEAVLKAVGSGLRTPMSDVRVSGPDDAPVLYSTPGVDAAQVALLDLDGTVGATPVLGALAAIGTNARPEVTVREHRTDRFDC